MRTGYVIPKSWAETISEIIAHLIGFSFSVGVFIMGGFYLEPLMRFISQLEKLWGSK